MPHHTKGLIFAHIAAVLFGMTGILGALISTDANFITFGRASFAFIALALVGYTLKVPLNPMMSRPLRRSLFLSGTLLAIHWITFFYAIKVGGVAMATLGFASFPAFITLIERFILKDTISKSAWVLVAIVIIGLLLVSPEMDTKNINTTGLLWGILSGFSFASLAVINRTISHALNPLAIAFWQNLIVALVTIPLVLWSPPLLTSSDILWLFILGVICTALSHYLFVSSVQYISARTTGLIIALEPVYAIIVAWLLFSEEPTLKMIIGGLLIIGAAIYPKTT
ncbi:DMT family transporter [Pelistega ratti]|nr:DMT family transporter [Pelistega ratti]